MRAVRRIACLAVLVVPAIAVATEEYGCDNVKFGDDVVQKFPNVVKACHGVTMKDGAPYAHFVAEVVHANKDAVTVHFLDKKDKAINKVKFAPAAEDRLKLEGKTVKYSDLEKGTRLSFYMAHDKWGLYASPDGKAMTILSREDL